MKEIEMEEINEAPTTTDVPVIRFRAVREALKLSRHDVEVATGLSGSTVWRAEQEGKKISDEDAAKIWAFLSAAQPKVGTSAKPKPTNSQRIASDLVKVQAIAAEYEQKLADHDLMLALVRSSVETAIAAAKEAKRSSKDLQSILELLDS